MPPKPALSITDQITLLTQRSLPVPDRDRMRLAKLLGDNGYARLARYWRYAQVDPAHGDKTFDADVTVSNLTASYEFDSHLRHLLAEGLEVFEITLRSRLGYFLAVGGATYTYRQQATYRPAIGQRQNSTARADLLAEIERDLGRAREDFITTALRRGDTPPLWDAMEVLSLGVVSKMYSLLADQTIRHQVARSFGYPNARFAESVFRSLTVVRNVCAHHARVWNRTNIQVPPPVLKRLKIDPDITIYQATPWAWIVVITDLVDTIRADHTYSSSLRAHIAAHPEYLPGLKYPKPA